MGMPLRKLFQVDENLWAFHLPQNHGGEIKSDMIFGTNELTPIVS